MENQNEKNKIQQQQKQKNKQNYKTWQQFSICWIHYKQRKKIMVGLQQEKQQQM